MENLGRRLTRGLAGGRRPAAVMARGIVGAAVLLGGLLAAACGSETTVPVSLPQSTGIIASPTLTIQPTVPPTPTPVPPTETPTPTVTPTPSPTPEPTLSADHLKVKQDIEKLLTEIKGENGGVEVSFMEGSSLYAAWKDYVDGIVYCPPPEYKCSPWQNYEKEVKDLLFEGFLRMIAQQKGKVRPDQTPQQQDEAFRDFLTAVKNQGGKTEFVVPGGVFHRNPKTGKEEDIDNSDAVEVEIDFNQPVNIEFAVNRKGVRDDVAGFMVSGGANFEIAVKENAKQKGEPYTFERLVVWMREANKDDPRFNKSLTWYLLEFYAAMTKLDLRVWPHEILTEEFWQRFIPGWPKSTKEDLENELLQIRWKGVEYPD